MIHVNINGALGQTITPSKGIPEHEIDSLRTSTKQYNEQWLRERENGEHQWSMDPYNKQIIEAVKETVSRINKQKTDTVIWIGIGGSGLGPKVIQEVFESVNTREMIVLDSIDPSVMNTLSKITNWRRTLIVIASKSGSTLEPMSAFFFCFNELKKAVKPELIPNHVIAITDPEKGLLHDFCIKHGLPMLPIPAGVGGRYSIFTPIGLLPLGLLNGDIDQFIRGAKEMDTFCQQNNLEKNPAMLLAVAQFLLDTKRNYPIRVIMPYCQRLMSIARWNQQLIAESLGKNELFNPIPLSAIGTQDQHSLLQQWQEGPRKFWHLFIKENEKERVTLPDDIDGPFSYIAGKTFSQLLDACYEGTSQALAEAKRPHATISMGRLDEYHLGQLFFLLLTEVVILGKLYRINPYGQPGVELGKKITKNILSKGKEE